MRIDGERFPFLLDDPAIGHGDAHDEGGFMPHARAAASIHKSIWSR
jgi:hypothetical protein